MSDSPEQWTDTKLMAQCAAGNPAAWNRLKEMFVEEAKAIIARCRRYGHLTADLIADAVQNVVCRLWEDHTNLRAALQPENGGLREHLIVATSQAVRNLLRKERRRQHHEQRAARSDEDRGTEESCREEMERLCARLRPDDQEVLRAALEGRLGELNPRLSKRELRNAKRRIRRKWKEQQG